MRIVIIGLIILTAVLLHPEKTATSQSSVEKLEAPQTPLLLQEGKSKELDGFVKRFDISTPKVCINQICDYYLTEFFKPATTTPCSIELPKATTTPLTITINSEATSTPITWTIATSTRPNSTTTVLYETTTESHVSIVIATTTVFGPVNRSKPIWLVVGAKGGTAANSENTFKGNCKTVLREL